MMKQHGTSQNFSLGGGGGADPKAIYIYIIFHFKNRVIKIMS